MNNFDFKTETPAKPLKPAQPLKPLKPAKPKEPIKPKVDPRAAYNCAPCKGSGLVKDSRSVDTQCLNCSGTGKV